MSAEVFERLDIDHNGVVDAVELAEAFRQDARVEVTVASCEAFLARYAADGAHLTRGEFVGLWDQARRLFEQADSDGDGEVTCEDLLRESSGYDRVHAARLLERLDANGEGTVNFAEFLFGLDLRAPTLQVALMHFNVGSSYSMLPWHPAEDPRKVLLCGSAAGVLAKTAVAPLSRLVLLQQLNSRPDVGSWQLLREMRAAGGWQALFRGNLVSTFKVAPTAAISMGTYMKLRERIDSPLVCGLIAGGLATLFMVPMENVRVSFSKLVRLFSCCVLIFPSSLLSFREARQRCVVRLSI